MTLQPLVKKAVGDDQTFETSLASIGRSVMSGKCPTLFKYEIGFQVLDADDDNTRAVGVFGFRIGDRILYAPMFYRDGRVKGTGQLRDPKRKRTVPLTDNWVNKIISERGDEAPKLTSRSHSRASAQPSLWQLKYPPSKYASERDRADMAELAKAAARDLARAIGRRPAMPETAIDLVKEAEAEPELFATMCRWAVRYPWFGDALTRYHGAAKIAAALERVREREKRAARTPPRRVRPRLASIPPAGRKQAAVVAVRPSDVRLDRRPLGGIDFSPGDLADLSAGRCVYRDRRKESAVSQITTWVGGNDATGTTVSNPGNCGVYKVMLSDGTLAPCAVMAPLVGWEKDQGRCVVVRLSDGACTTSHVNAVWTVGEADPHDYAQWVQSLPDVGDSLPKGDTFLALTPDRYKTVATVPFSVRDDGCEAYEYCAYDGVRRAPYWGKSPERSSETKLTPRYRVETAPRRARLWSKPGVPFLSGNCLYVPTDAKILKLGDDRLDLATGTDPEHLELKDKKASGDLVLVVGTGSGGFYADDPRSAKRAWYSEPYDCEAALVLGHGLSPADARRFVDSASRTGKCAAAVKYADGYQGLSHSYPNAPGIDEPMTQQPHGFADDVVPSETSASLEMTIEDLMQQSDTADRYRSWPVQAGVRAPMEGIGNGTATGGGVSEEGAGGPGGAGHSLGPTDKDLQVISRAARTGRKELFDTAGLAALVKHTRLPRLLEETSARMAKTISDLGDIIAHMAWNVDEWTEQFGESEIGPIEDQVQDIFDGLGDLSLTLQEKQVTSLRDFGILPREYEGDGGDNRN